MIQNKIYLLTGGTGSFGNKFIDMAIKSKSKFNIIIYSRDEMKQWFMQKRISDPRVIFVIGDVRDKSQLKTTIRKFNIEIIIHAAATKIVPLAEINASECFKTNVLGAINIVEASYNSSVEKVIALSTDKASNPINLYGASKLASDKIFIAANLNNFSSIKYSIVRYGNVMGSRGSIIPLFLKQNIESDYFTITDLNMTRFMVKLSNAVSLVLDALKIMKGGETFILKSPSMKIIDIANTINPNKKIKVTGILPGEKIHEQMISADDSFHTHEYKNLYIIYSSIVSYKKLGKPVGNGFTYKSDNNQIWLKSSDLLEFIKKESKTFL